MIQICSKYSWYDFEPGGIPKMPSLLDCLERTPNRSDRSDCGWEGCSTTSVPGDLMESLSAESDSEATAGGFATKTEELEVTRVHHFQA